MRLIDADEIRLPHGFFEKVDNVPKFYEWLGTLPTVDVDSLNAKHEDIGYEKGYRDGYAEALEVADNTEHIRHGHWEWNDYGGFGNYHCTVCRYIPYGKFSRKFRPDYMYCPRCGAKMDEVEDDD